MAAVCYAAWALLWRAGVNSYSWGQVLAAAVIVEAALVLLVLRPTVIVPGAWLYGGLAGACAAGGYLLFIYGLSGVKHVYPVIIMSSYPVLVALAAFLIFKQPMGWEKWLGVLLAVAGVALVAK